MEDTTKRIEEFRQFANDKLKTHQDELHTRYENEKIDSATLEQGYEQHRNILQKELAEKIDILLSGDENPWLQAELKRLGETYIEQLSANHF